MLPPMELWCFLLLDSTDVQNNDFLAFAQATISRRWILAETESVRTVTRRSLALLSKNQRIHKWIGMIYENQSAI